MPIYSPNWQLLDVQTPSGATTVPFTTGFTTDFYHWMLDIEDMTFGTDESVLALQVSTDGGSTWKTGASDNSHSTETTITATGTANDRDNDNSSIQLTRSGNANERIGNTSASGATESLSGTIHCWNLPQSNRFPFFKWDLIYRSNADRICNSEGTGSVASPLNVAVDAVRLLETQGSHTITGTVRLYGWVA